MASEPSAIDQADLVNLLDRVKSIAREYYEKTGRPLGVTGEVAELEVVRLITGATLAAVREPGHDVIGLGCGARNPRL